MINQLEQADVVADESRYIVEMGDPEPESVCHPCSRIHRTDFFGTYTKHFPYGAERMFQTDLRGSQIHFLCAGLCNRTNPVHEPGRYKQPFPEKR